MRIFEILNIIGIMLIVMIALLHSHIAAHLFFFGLFIGFLLMIPYELKNCKNDSKNANEKDIFFLMQKKYVSMEIIFCAASFVIFLMLVYERRGM